MKYVKKGEAPGSFKQWLAKENDDWKPTYKGLQNPEKEQLHQALMKEQGGVCCYCGCRIEQQNSHVEHFHPQEHYPALALEYTNLHVSCIRERKPGAPLHCGHAKGDDFDQVQAISPTNPDCEQMVRYTLDGKIIPENDQAAYMCCLLELGIVPLNSRRAAVLAGVFDKDFLVNATHEELMRLREGYRQLDEEDRLPDFGHVVVRYAEQLAGIT